MNSSDSSRFRYSSIADDQCCDFDGMVTDIFDEDVELKVVKIHLLSHFRDHIRCFGNIKMYSTESGKTNHKTIIKENYRRLYKNEPSDQIL